MEAVTELRSTSAVQTAGWGRRLGQVLQPGDFVALVGDLGAGKTCFSRGVAEGAGVPLVANPPLARALHRLEVGAEIPAEHYQAVAEIIAFVWRRAGGART